MISVPLKGGVEVLAQMVNDPYLVFFDRFLRPGEWEAVRLGETPVLFVCAVVRSFLWCAERRDLEPAADLALPRRWISTFPGSRWATVWPGTPKERRFGVLNREPGGKLIEKDITARGFTEEPVVTPRIDLADDATIDAHELDVLWTFPLLNERLHLCHLLGEKVDPLKELYFDRPLRPEFETFIDIYAGHGRLADWGYHRGGPCRLNIERARKAGKTKAGKTKAGKKAGTTKAGKKAGTTKAGTTKAGTTKAGRTKAGRTKAGTKKAGTTKAGTTKAGTTKAGTTKAGTTKAGTTKAGTTKAGTTKAGTRR